VNKEVTYWLDHNSPATLLIGLTDGELAWDEERGGFVSPTALPLPPALTGRLPSEPKWVDLRGYREGASPRDSKFLELGADFAAAIRGMPKEDLLSQELRQQRRALTLAYSGVATLAVLIVIAAWQWKVAVENEKRAVANERVATEQKQIAQQQRDRAEKTLETATKTANDMVFSLAQDFRDETGMPVHLMRRILDRARGLQDQLTASGESSPELKRTEEVALNELMMTYLAQGDAKAALDAAERAVAIAEGLAQLDPRKMLWQDDLAITYSRLADALMGAGRRADAFAFYRKALGISEKLAAAAPDDAGAHRRLAIDHARLGNAFSAEGDRPEALAQYQTSLRILQRFGERDAEWQWSLALAHGHVGEALPPSDVFLLPESGRASKTNRLLASLKKDELSLLAKHLREVPIKQGEEVLEERGEPVDLVHFPLSGMVSLIVEMPEDRAVEIGTVGSEGAVGLTVGLGSRTGTVTALVQVSGSALCISAQVFRTIARKSEYLNDLIVTYNEMQIGQIQQTAACNALHDVGSRLARWLLQTSDKTGKDTIPFTQEFLSKMLGVRRGTISAVATRFETAKLIHTNRGQIHIINRERLKKQACGCYEFIAQHIDRLLPKA
jgi:CRP-like cAMP-binding protein/uncharacterized glyoxalase superfamily protein PhnB